MSDLKGLEEYVDKTGKGVWVQASTLGSLEALLEFLRSSKIPVMGVNIGPVYKRDIMKTAAMLEKAPEYAVVLCFDVTVEKEAKALADELNVKVFEGESSIRFSRSACACLPRLLLMLSLPSNRQLKSFTISLTPSPPTWLTFSRPVVKTPLPTQSGPVDLKSSQLSRNEIPSF